ncbi:MAG TPA: tRNA (adenosine(37)-N6)-threonylcarbamoyltransferase complex transferase subunit TsaD [Candidatus Sumerlaeota bacterium]|nr:tRNA (adenosine(37)-N6)-threonylcarbamoyltransferase complex transferase subunit TsaD [Candidatus Sumerlaeota bacterium]
MLILGIETSCDETACAVVADGHVIHSNIIASQIASHSPFGGIVPELASRLHIENSVAIIRAALNEAGCSLGDLDALAVTSGPGLIGSLLVGVETAKAVAWTIGKPLVPVHHIAGHLYTPFLMGKDRKPVLEGFDYPYLGLVVSGGHSSLIYVRSPLEYEIIGRTLDDAAGEAYDKVARILGLGYPGGPVIDRLSREGDPEFVSFPRPGKRSEDCDLSFSGLKTAVVRFLTDFRKQNGDPAEKDIRNITASFQAAVVDTLLAKTRRALELTGAGRLAIVGGVACNSALRRGAAERLSHVAICIPPPVLCTDNAAMIAGLAAHLLADGRIASPTLNADAAMTLA